jgi:hypothetical protein
MQAALPLGAKVAESVWQFLSWSGVDAFIYCDSQWFGLWPLEVALQIPQHAEESGASSRMGLQVEHTTNESRTPATHYRPWLCYVPPSVLDAADQRILTRLAEGRIPHFLRLAGVAHPASGDAKKTCATPAGTASLGQRGMFRSPQRIGLSEPVPVFRQSAMALLVVERTEHADAADRKHRRVVANTRLPL